MSSFKKAVAEFKKASESWLSAEDLPALAALEGAAAELDREITPALLSSFGLTYRNLLKRKPVEVEEEVDELDDLIPHG